MSFSLSLSFFFSQACRVIRKSALFACCPSIDESDLPRMSLFCLANPSIHPSTIHPSIHSVISSRFVSGGDCTNSTHGPWRRAEAECRATDSEIRSSKRESETHRTSAATQEGQGTQRGPSGGKGGGVAVGDCPADKMLSPVTQITKKRGDKYIGYRTHRLGTAEAVGDLGPRCGFLVTGLGRTRITCQSRAVAVNDCAQLWNSGPGPGFSRIPLSLAYTGDL